jgi:preprotein translocase subunit SecD
MRRNTIVFMVILVVTIVAAAIVFPLNGGAIFNRPLQLGLDLSGGVHLVYQADLSKIPADEQNSAMDADVAAITQRVDAFGVTNPVIQREGADRILVELAGIQDVEKAKQLIGQTAVLEFGELTTENDPAAKWTNDLGSWKPAMGVLDGEQVELTSAYFEQNTYVTTNPTTGGIVLVFKWNAEGAKLSQEITSRLVGKQLGIFSGNEGLKADDGHLIAPVVQEAIISSGEITGLSQTDANMLSRLLNAGRIPVPLNPVYEQTVSPIAGAHFVDLAYKAAIIALALVFIFMSIYYKLPGVLAGIALVIYAVLNLAVYKIWPGSITLTLAGIAGFVTSMGMAVDANVLIFERMKEELRSGRTVGASIEAGFKRAWTAIWDTAMTTVIACVILLILGNSVVSSGLITGFAITLLIGVVLSMITAITMTRTFLRLFIGTSIAEKTAIFTTIGGK